MAEKLFRFPALRVTQGDGSPALVLFSASAVRVEAFAGIPQKRRVQNGETVGFQRDVDDDRVRSLAKFYSTPTNVIANPLLCAIRQPEGVEVTFSPLQPAIPPDGPPAVEVAIPGELVVRFPNYAELTLLQLFGKARQALELRVPELGGRDDPAALIQSLAPMIGQEDFSPADDNESENQTVSDVTEDLEAGISDASGSGEEALFEESHVTEFWDTLRAREILLGKLSNAASYSMFLGFGRDALEAYLLPIVLVDGQHRLLGAILAAKQESASNPNLSTLTETIRAGIGSSAALNENRLLDKARRLPISLLMDARPQEHVFQFVIVNQKATPVRAALLETIISSSLSEAELGPIADRLEDAGVPLRTARSMTYLVRNLSSPFYRLVARGMAEEGSELLPWTVLGQIASLFRDLKGARYFHDRKSDYADIWRRRYLDQSAIVADPAAPDATGFDTWNAPDGTWRDVFIAFWSAVRETLADTQNQDAPNYWGRPRTSNLFNKPSLLTLATDFFAFLVETRGTIESISAVSSLVADWLRDVDRNYFARDWRLSGVKKDAVGTRKQWSSIWQNYRIDPKALPNVKLYSSLYKER